MNFRNKGIIKIRKGHLANFSGGAGYMPFVVIFSVPVSIICTLISNIVILSVAKGLERKSKKEQVPIELFKLENYIRIHIKICFAIGIISTIFLCIWGYMSMYSYSTNALVYIPSLLCLAAGPIAAFILSTYYLIKNIVYEMKIWKSFFIAIGIYLVITAISIYMGILLSSI